MRSLIAAEYLKLRTTRSAPVTLAVVVLLSAVMPLAYATAAGSGDIPTLTPGSLPDMLLTPARLIGAAVLLLGVLAAAAEYGHRTIVTARLQEPRATRLLTAKLVSLALLGLVVGVTAEVVALTASAVTLTQHHAAVQVATAGVGKVLVLVPLAVALQGALGVAIGALLRNTAAAVGVTLVWALVVEGVLPVVLRRPELSSWLPAGAINEVTASRTASGALGAGAAALLVLAYATALVAGTVTLDRRREL
jgi:ABC-2 type transport system permease protein